MSKLTARTVFILLIIILGKQSQGQVFDPSYVSFSDVRPNKEISCVEMDSDGLEGNILFENGYSLVFKHWAKETMWSNMVFSSIGDYGMPSIKDLEHWRDQLLYMTELIGIDEGIQETIKASFDAPDELIWDKNEASVRIDGSNDVFNEFIIDLHKDVTNVIIYKVYWAKY